MCCSNNKYSLHDNLLPKIIGMNLTVLIIDYSVNKKQEKKVLDDEFEVDI